MHFLLNGSGMNVNKPKSTLVGNGLVLSSNKPLSEPLLISIYVTIWPHQKNLYVFVSFSESILKIFWGLLQCTISLQSSSQTPKMLLSIICSPISSSKWQVRQSKSLICRIVCWCHWAIKPSIWYVSIENQHINMHKNCWLPLHVCSSLLGRVVYGPR